jgi:hypothetical protein
VGVVAAAAVVVVVVVVAVAVEVVLLALVVLAVFGGFSCRCGRGGSGGMGVFLERTNSEVDAPGVTRGGGVEAEAMLQQALEQRQKLGHHPLGVSHVGQCEVRQE